MQAVARQSFVRITPRKMRVVADIVRGKTCNQALSMLRFVPKAASPFLAKAIKAAVASATQQSDDPKFDPDTLRVSEIRVDEGVKMKRMRPRARGRADIRRRRTSHLTVRVSNQ
ncbi:MAG TPA: 50S ribosomal protein L22 [candidate division Zixibacteria bacterium]|jgi:large subunit ribosomal protein L22|nr:50S ribosomal protein L22 [candidate division Zixibacteria bacterium]